MVKTGRTAPELIVEKRQIFSSLTNSSQLVATIKPSAADSEHLDLELAKNEFSSFFRFYNDFEANAWLLETVPGLCC